MNLPDINERIKSLIDKHAMGNKSRFADMCNIGSSFKISRLFKIDKRSKNYPVASIDIIIAIANTFENVDLNWLVLGKENDVLNEPTGYYKKEEKLSIQGKIDILVKQNEKLLKQNDDIIDKLNRPIIKEALEREKARTKKENKQS